MESLSVIAQTIRDRDFFCILTHNYPDGDAIGSAYGLCRALQKIGKRAKVKLGCDVPEKFKFLTQNILAQDFIPQNYISVDLADINLLHESVKELSDIDICIDHHKSNKNYAKLSYIDSHAAANCEIIFRLMSELKCELDSPLAECLYVGIATDTGGFMYDNTTSQTHEIVAELMKRKIDIGKINQDIFILESKKKFDLKRVIYNNLKICFDGKVAITHITLSEMDSIGISDNELDGIASVPIKIEGVEIGVTIREQREGICKVSVRTRQEIDADKFCGIFGGGGHERAGGFKVSGSAEAVADSVRRAVIEFTGWNE